MTNEYFEWLQDDHEWKSVKLVTNKPELSQEGFDKWLLASYGHKGDTRVKSSVKKCKTTILGNPYIHGGLY